MKYWPGYEPVEIEWESFETRFGAHYAEPRSLPVAAATCAHGQKGYSLVYGSADHIRCRACKKLVRVTPEDRLRLCLKRPGGKRKMRTI